MPNIRVGLKMDLPISAIYGPFLWCCYLRVEFDHTADIKQTQVWQFTSLIYENVCSQT